MSEKSRRITHLVSTGLLTLMMAGSAIGMYLLNTAEVQAEFSALGYPTYLVIPLAIVKLCGLLAIWLFPRRPLQEWAYAGFFFDFVLAFVAHFMVGDGEFAPALVATLILMVSYFSRSHASPSDG